MTHTEEQELWERTRKHGDQGARERLIERHLPMVRHEAWLLQRGTIRSLDHDELIGAGALGLLQAVDKFDHERGWKFGTFAVRRIRGAMVDQMRKQAGLPQRTRMIARKLAEARTRVENRIGRLATEAQVAEELGVDRNQFLAWEQAAARTEVAYLGEVHAPTTEEMLPLDTEWLAEAIAALPERERMVIQLGFFEQLTGRVIAQRLAVTESRVSQIRSQAIARLRAQHVQREAA